MLVLVVAAGAVWGHFTGSGSQLTVLLCLQLAGRDATDMVENYHPASVFQTWLPQFHVGEIVDHTVSELVAGHRSIRQELLRQGMFESDTAFYVMHGARCVRSAMEFTTRMLCTLTTPVLTRVGARQC